MDFSPFDIRRYPTVDVTDGYAAWAPTYEATVMDLMDLRLLGRDRSVRWSDARRALDLACGTGRIGAWLATQGVRSITGVDLTRPMLARAAEKGVYERLVEASILDTGLEAGAYDLITQSLACEHLEDVRPLYAEVARLLAPGGAFAIVGFHPFFLMKGVPTHFDRAPGEPVAIRSWVHLISDHVKAARAAGLALEAMDESLIDDEVLGVKGAKWEKYRHWPVTFLMVWRRPS
jgi:SAM-dependent methyltransferase